MKRGKDDEKVKEPMFPRLHVNDRGKGGPRAPPRNKMALYEQLTIPSQSQRYNSGSTTNNTMTPSTSTFQGTSHERNMYFPLYRPTSTSPYDEAQASLPEAADLSNQLALGENRKPPLDEDDFMVPIFSQSVTQTCIRKPQNIIHEERQNHLTLPSSGDKEIDQSTSGDLISKHRSSRMPNAPRKYSSDILVKEKDDRRWKKDVYNQSGHPDNNRMSGLEKTSAHLRQDHEDDFSVLDGINGMAVLDQLFENNGEEISLRPSHYPHVRCRSRGDNEFDSGMLRVEEYQTLEKESMDKGDGASEASVVDTVTVLDMSPDDVVRVIGRKHFWTARTAIANQQRLFAVQIFELHRLIKVQKLIAESPELLLGSAFVGKPSLKGSTVKKYSSDYAVKTLDDKSASKDVSHKAADKVEGTAENAVTKSPPVQLQDAIKPAPFQPSSDKAVSSFTPVNMDPKMNPWSFPQPGPQQWLVPVMTPSEGLVYKPYPAPGFMGPTYGGCGPGGSTPVMNPGYGMPTPHYQGMVMSPGMQFGGQGYCPPYGMPMPMPMPMQMPMPMPMISPSMSGSTVEQLNPFLGQNPYNNHMGQPVGTSVNSGGMQHQGSLNTPSQINGTVAPVARPQPIKERELQGSTASSPSQRTQEMCRVPLVERRDALPLFPAAPTAQISEVSPIEKPTKVIRVVPHKPGSTRESAARIFQSIQEERQQFE